MNIGTHACMATKYHSKCVIISAKNDFHQPFSSFPYILLFITLTHKQQNVKVAKQNRQLHYCSV